MEAKTKDKLKNLLRIFFLFFSLAILYFLLKSIGFDKVGDSFVKVGIGGMLILICCGFVENCFDSLGLYFAVPRRNKNFVRVFASNCIGALTNLFIPWEVGELVKIGLIKEIAGSENSIKGVILWNYILKLSKACSIFAMVFLSLVFSFILQDEYYQIDKFWLILLYSLLGFLPYFGITILIHLNMSVKIAKLLKFFGKKNADELMKKAEQMDSDLKLFRKNRPSDYKKTFWLQFFARYVSLLTFILCAYFSGFSNYKLSILILTFCAINLSDYIIAFIPIKLGVGEGVGFLMFAFMGLSGDAGGLVTFILRVKAIIAMSLVSTLIIVKSKDKNEITQ